MVFFLKILFHVNDYRHNGAESECHLGGGRHGCVESHHIYMRCHYVSSVPIVAATMGKKKTVVEGEGNTANFDRSAKVLDCHTNLRSIMLYSSATLSFLTVTTDILHACRNAIFCGRKVTSQKKKTKKNAKHQRRYAQL